MRKFWSFVLALSVCGGFALTAPVGNADNLDKEFPAEPRTGSSYGGVYQCRFEQALSVDDDGKLSKGIAADMFAQLHNNFLFDADTGQLKSQGLTTPWRIIRPGSSAWDLTAHVAKEESIDNIMRIQVWRRPVTFLMTNNKDVLSGICIRP